MRWFVGALTVIVIVMGLFFFKWERPQSLNEVLADVEGYSGSHVLVPLSEGGAILIYSVLPKEFGDEGVGAGLLEGNEADGWIPKKGQGWGWMAYGNQDVVMSQEDFHLQDPKHLAEITVHYGLIQNPYVHEVFVKYRSTDEWMPATFVKEQRIFYNLEDTFGIKAFAENGDLISMEGTGDREMNNHLNMTQAGYWYLSDLPSLTGYNYYFLGATPHKMTKEERQAVGGKENEDNVEVTKLEYLFPVTPEQYGPPGKNETRVTLFVKAEDEVYGYITTDGKKTKLVKEQ